MTSPPAGDTRPVVLVVDDLADALELYQEFLELQGYRVEVAANGREAVDRAREIRPDLVLMDLSMPVMDGYAATRLLKEDARTSHIPVLALTGHVMPRQQHEAHAAGCDTIVPKPCQPTRLAAKIRAMLHSSKPAD